MASVVGVGDFIGWDGACLLIGRALRVVPKHSHQAIQIVFGHSGPVSLRGGDVGEWTEYPLGVIPSRQPHSMDATRSTYVVVLFVEPETRDGKALTELYLAGGIATIDDTRVRQACADVFAVWLARAGDQAVIGATQRLIEALTGAAAPADVTDERILRAVEYINSNLGGMITLDDVAADVFLSPGRFRHLFVEQTGMGLRPYVLWRRFLRAWELLANGESVSTAAHGAGFADSAHFARTSRQTFGFPPSLLEVAKTSSVE
jgi:AraC family transcriptional regulator